MRIQADDDQRAWQFFAVAFAFSWAFWIPNALASNGVVLPEGVANFLAGPLNPAAFGPTFAAFLMTLLYQGGRGIVQLLRRGVSVRFRSVWLAAILLLPLLVFSGSVFTAILAGVRTFDPSVITNPPFALIAFFVILFTSGPLQEEFGWRGYALPRLQSRFNALTSSLIVGFFWWLWHLPAVFIPGRFMADNLPVFLALAVVIMLTSILFTWVYNNTDGSVLAALLMHTAMNWSIWIAMPNMRMDLPTAAFMIGFLAVAVIIIVKISGAAHLRRAPAGIEIST